MDPQARGPLSKPVRMIVRSILKSQGLRYLDAVLELLAAQRDGRKLSVRSVAGAHGLSPSSLAVTMRCVRSELEAVCATERISVADLLATVDDEL